MLPYSVPGSHFKLKLDILKKQEVQHRVTLESDFHLVKYGNKPELERNWQKNSTCKNFRI